MVRSLMTTFCWKTEWSVNDPAVWWHVDSGQHLLLPWYRSDVTRNCRLRCRCGGNGCCAVYTSVGIRWNTADTHSVAEKMRLSEPTSKIWMKVDPYYQRQKCRPMILVSRGIRLCTRRFPGEGASNDSGVVAKSNFQRFRWLLFRKF